MKVFLFMLRLMQHLMLLLIIYQILYLTLVPLLPKQSKNLQPTAPFTKTPLVKRHNIVGVGSVNEDETNDPTPMPTLTPIVHAIPSLPPPPLTEAEDPLHTLECDSTEVHIIVCTVIYQAIKLDIGGPIAHRKWYVIDSLGKRIIQHDSSKVKHMSLLEMIEHTYPSGHVLKVITI